jgi:hypothetical protein
MKINFVKKVGKSGEPHWYTTNNGSYVRESASYDEEEARKFFNNYVHMKANKIEQETILESVEIN